MKTEQNEPKPQASEYMSEPVRWSDWLDFLGRLENELERREEFWRTTQNDSHGIATAMMCATAEVKQSLRTVVAEVVARKSNDKMSH
jgi:hypothetical protein